jgi:hypothetical protein
LGDYFNGGFVLFSTRGVKKHPKNFSGEVHLKNFCPKNLRKNKPSSCRIFPSIFLSHVLGVSLYEELKNTTKYVLKSYLKTSKNLQKKVGR